MVDEKNLEELFAEEAAIPDGAEKLSRRRFLTGAVAGGAAGLAVAAGTGAAVWRFSDAEVQAIRADADAEIARLQGLVTLYEDLEKVGMDAILATGMKALSLPLGAIELGAKALRSGLEWAKETLRSLGDALPTAEESLRWLESQVETVSGSLSKLEKAVGDALDKATDNAVAAALEDLVNLVFDNLPFGLGDKIRLVLEEMVRLVTSVDDLIAGINTTLLTPLREKWFSAEDGKGLGATLVTPLVEKVLDPVEAHLENLASLAEVWQQDFLSPTELALAEREQIRQEITSYKKDHGFA